MRYLLISILLVITGCAALQPAVDICAPYPTVTERSYCYASNEVTAARNAVTQSLKDGALTVEQARKAAGVLSDADAVLDRVELLITVGDLTQADTQLLLARQILLELNR